MPHNFYFDNARRALCLCDCGNLASRTAQVKYWGVVAAVGCGRSRTRDDHHERIREHTRATIGCEGCATAPCAFATMVWAASSAAVRTCHSWGSVPAGGRQQRGANGGASGWCWRSC